MSNKLSIIIPCYNQVDLLERNLNYLEKQSFKDFNIVIIDDQISQDYKKVIGKFSNFNITYIRNEKNLGAIKNIFNSIFYKTNSEYQISLHEDDVLHSDYLKKAVEILDGNKRISFVTTLALWFTDSKDLETKFNKSKTTSDKTLIVDKVNFIREILKGKHIMLGSAVYRNPIKQIKPDYETYDVLCDRPFLASLLDEGSSASIINDKLIFTRDHGNNDHRSDTVVADDCFNLMSFYKESLPKPISEKDYNDFLTFSTNNLIHTYNYIKTENISFYSFIKKGMQLDLIKFSHINRIGVAGLLKFIYNKK